MVIATHVAGMDTGKADLHAGTEGAELLGDADAGHEHRNNGRSKSGATNNNRYDQHDILLELRRQGDGDTSWIGRMLPDVSGVKPQVMLSSVSFR
jgi:hypothetical protein